MRRNFRVREMAVDENRKVRLYFRKLCSRAVAAFRLENDVAGGMRMKRPVRSKIAFGAAMVCAWCLTAAAQMPVPAAAPGPGTRTTWSSAGMRIACISKSATARCSRR